MRTQRYWKPEEYEIRSSLSIDDASAEFLEIFKNAVSSRLRSAYPVGIELSDGLDSSSVTMMADRIGFQQDWYTLALRFGHMDCDEGQYIDAISYRIIHTPIERDVDQLNFNTVHKLSNYYATVRDWPSDLFFYHIFYWQRKPVKTAYESCLQDRAVTK